MNTRTAFNNRCIQLCIVMLQFLYLAYYLNFSNTKFSNDILMIVALLVLLVGTVLWVVNHNGRITVSLIVATFGALWSVLCSILNGSGLGSALTQTCVLMSICLFSETSFSYKKWKRMIIRMTLILAIVLWIFSNPDIYRSFYHARLLYFPDTVGLNPNTVAMLSFFLLVYFVQFIEVSVQKAKLKRFLQIASALIIAWQIWMTGARTSILAGGAFIVYLIFFRKRFGTIHNKKLFLIAMSISIFIPLIYVVMYNTGFLVSNTFFGKGFYSGREQVWLDVFERILDNPIFGSSNKLSFSYKNLLSAHNSLLAVLCYFGVAGLIACVTVLHKSYKKLHPTNNAMPMVAILCATFIMCFETVMTDWSLVWPFCFLFIRVEEDNAS